MTPRDWLALQMLAQRAEPWKLRSPALRVFFFVAADLDTDEFRPVKQTLIARKLGVGQQAVSRALRELVLARYLELGEPLGVSKQYRLRTDIAAVQSLYAA